MIDRERRLQWQKEREEADQTWRDNQREEDKRWRRMELIVIGGIVTAVAVAGQLIAAFIQRGTIP